MQETKERPILFSSPMIRAILEGRKTQTRRTIKPQPELCSGCQSCEFRCDHFRTPLKPKWEVGDRLWCRETWLQQDDKTYCYKADPIDKEQEDIRRQYGYTWKPSIHMPKKACRLWLEVTNVRVERLQDIDEEGAIVEGIEFKPQGKNIFYKIYGGGDMWQDDPAWSFRSLWESINGANSWDLNPFIYVIEFRRIDNAN